MSGHEQFDISRKQREVLEWKTARRAMLRTEFQKKYQNPLNHSAIVDDAVLRLMSARDTSQEFFIPTWRSFFRTIFPVGVITVGLFYIIVAKKTELEKKIRTGQISYADRDFRFS